MKSTAWIPWIFFCVALAALGTVYFSGQRKETELTQLRDGSQQLQTQIAEAEEAKKNLEQTQTQELTRLRSENADLLRLRNEVRELRVEKEQLGKQLQTAQSSVVAQRQKSLQEAQQLAVEKERVRAIVVKKEQSDQQTFCINNLRQIDGAKQQWALENQRPATEVPTPNEITPYFKEKTLPVCPAGGIYRLNAVAAEPTCNIPGHVVPNQ